VAPSGRVLGIDGKTYPAWSMHLDDLDFLRGRVHFLAHHEHLSIRQIVTRIEEDHGVHRSVGTVHSWLTDWRCEHCSG
jgi:hypothetical protein